MLTDRDEFEFVLPPEESQAIFCPLLNPWVEVYVQAGRISRMVKPHVYSIGSLLVETNSQLLILLDSKELENGFELFRVAAVSDGHHLEDMLMRMRPSISALAEVPVDLCIKSFVGVKNDISLVRFTTMVDEGGRQITTITDSGLLAANDRGRLLLYPNEGLPLDLCITTDEETIEQVLAKASVIPLGAE